MTKCKSLLRRLQPIYFAHANHICCCLRRLAMIDKLPSSSSYDSFAYEVALLEDFVQDGDAGNGKTAITSSLRQPGRKKRRATGLNNSLRVGSSMRGSFRGASRFGIKKTAGKDELNSSIHSAGSMRGRNTVTRAASSAAVSS